MSVVDRETTVHRQSSPDYGILDDNVWFPVNHTQVRDLLGKLLTQLDAMALPDRAHKAARSLLVAEVWRWWDGVYENATTSFEGCLAPVVTRGPRVEEGVPASNRWGWESEAAWLAAVGVRAGAEQDGTRTINVVLNTAASGVGAVLRERAA